MLEIIAVLIISALIALLARVGINIHRSILHPSTFMCIYGSLFLLAPIIFAPDFYLSIPAAIYITLCCFFFLIGGAISDSMVRHGTFNYNANKNNQTSNRGIPRVNTSALDAFLILGAASGGLAGVYLLLSKGIPPSNIFSISKLIAAGSFIAAERYAEEIAPPAISRALLTLTYASAIIGGISYHAARKSKAICFAPFAGIILYSTLLTARAPFLYVGILWASGFFSGAVWFKKEDLKLFSLKSLAIYTLIALGLTLGFIALQMIRGGIQEIHIAIALLDKLRVWFFGYLAGFSVWFDSVYFNDVDFSYGAYTFAGIFDALGINKRNIGIYSDFTQISTNYSTNIFTIYRSLILDYGATLCLALFLPIGFVMNSTYQKSKSGNLFRALTLAAFYGVILWSHVTSLLAYNLLIAAYFIAYLVCLYSAKYGPSPND